MFFDTDVAEKLVPKKIDGSGVGIYESSLGVYMPNLTRFDARPYDTLHESDL